MTATSATPGATSAELRPFTEAETLTWHQWTVFTTGRGLDGSLRTEGGRSLPLDVYTRAEHDAMARRMRQRDLPAYGDGVGIAISPCETLDQAREAVRTWCRDHLRRHDIQFAD